VKSAALTRRRDGAPFLRPAHLFPPAEQICVASVRTSPLNNEVAAPDDEAEADEYADGVEK
jgi:hypothetical protein